MAPDGKNGGSIYTWRILTVRTHHVESLSFSLRNENLYRLGGIGYGIFVEVLIVQLHPLRRRPVLEVVSVFRERLQDRRVSDGLKRATDIGKSLNTWRYTKLYANKKPKATIRSTVSLPVQTSHAGNKEQASGNLTVHAPWDTSLPDNCHNWNLRQRHPEIYRDGQDGKFILRLTCRMWFRRCW